MSNSVSRERPRGRCDAYRVNARVSDREVGVNARSERPEGRGEVRMLSDREVGEKA